MIALVSESGLLGHISTHSSFPDYLWAAVPAKNYIFQQGKMDQYPLAQSKYGIPDIPNHSSLQ